MEKVDVAVIGAGATGAGIARDLALRGLHVALVEKGDVACGTSGRNHGLLHSGGRYAVKDREAAVECIRENGILRRIAAHCIDPCGGMFVGLEGDDPGYADRFEAACAGAGIEAIRIGPGEALEREPALSRRVREAFVVPDASIDPFFLCLANVVDAAEHGASILTHKDVYGILVEGGRVRGLELRDLIDGSEQHVSCGMVVNAAGPWAGVVASHAGLEVGLMLSRGALVVTRGRLVRGVVNRLRPPSDGDIVVPGGPVCLVGTTSVTVGSPDDLAPDPGEASKLVTQGGDLVPAIHEARMIREFTGIRPLFKPGDAEGGGRDVSRGFAVIDHGTRDGLEGMITIVGGKLTTYRLMAEKVADLVARKLGVEAPCTTAEDLLPGSEPPGDARWPIEMPGWEARALEARHGSRSPLVIAIEASRDAGLSGLTRLCMCESVPEAEIRFAVRRLHARTLDDVRRRTRLGMGPCQGSSCAPRAAAVLADELGLDAAGEIRVLREFLRERLFGRLAVLTHGGAAQEELSRTMALGLTGGEVTP